MNRTKLREAAGLSFNVIAKIGKCERVSMESLIKFVKRLNALSQTS
ncbi:MAG: hypothetical protein FWG30_10170 [Eubacteriaceae bacterium]|jgi:DNA (cytosine-5)-methyltransferase 1|nr:hypothetical protein [Eubacteriaceae bacterium]